MKVSLNTNKTNVVLKNAYLDWRCDAELDLAVRFRHKYEANTSDCFHGSFARLVKEVARIIKAFRISGWPFRRALSRYFVAVRVIGRAARAYNERSNALKRAYMEWWLAAEKKWKLDDDERKLQRRSIPQSGPAAERYKKIYEHVNVPPQDDVRREALNLYLMRLKINFMKRYSAWSKTYKELCKEMKKRRREAMLNRNSKIVTDNPELIFQIRDNLKMQRRPLIAHIMRKPALQIDPKNEKLEHLCDVTDEVNAQRLKQREAELLAQYDREKDARINGAKVKSEMRRKQLSVFPAAAAAAAARSSSPPTSPTASPLPLGRRSNGNDANKKKETQQRESTSPASPLDSPALQSVVKSPPEDSIPLLPGAKSDRLSPTKNSNDNSNNGTNSKNNGAPANGGVGGGVKIKKRHQQQQQLSDNNPAGFASPPEAPMTPLQMHSPKVTTPGPMSLATGPGIMSLEPSRPKNIRRASQVNLTLPLEPSSSGSFSAPTAAAIKPVKPLSQHDLVAVSSSSFELTIPSDDRVVRDTGGRRGGNSIDNNLHHDSMEIPFLEASDSQHRTDYFQQSHLLQRSFNNKKSPSSLSLDRANPFMERLAPSLSALNVNLAELDKAMGRVKETVSRRVSFFAGSASDNSRNSSPVMERAVSFCVESEEREVPASLFHRALPQGVQQHHQQHRSSIKSNNSNSNDDDDEKSEALVTASARQRIVDAVTSLAQHAAPPRTSPHNAHAAFGAQKKRGDDMEHEQSVSRLYFPAKVPFRLLNARGLSDVDVACRRVQLDAQRRVAGIEQDEATLEAKEDERKRLRKLAVEKQFRDDNVIPGQHVKTISRTAAAAATGGAASPASDGAGNNSPSRGQPQHRQHAQSPGNIRQILGPARAAAALASFGSSPTSALLRGAAPASPASRTMVATRTEFFGHRSCMALGRIKRRQLRPLDGAIQDPDSVADLVSGGSGGDDDGDGVHGGGKSRQLTQTMLSNAVRTGSSWQAARVISELLPDGRKVPAAGARLPPGSGEVASTRAWSSHVAETEQEAHRRQQQNASTLSLRAGRMTGATPPPRSDAGQGGVFDYLMSTNAAVAPGPAAAFFSPHDHVRTKLRPLLEAKISDALNRHQHQLQSESKQQQQQQPQHVSPSALRCSRSIASLAASSPAAVLKNVEAALMTTPPPLNRKLDVSAMARTSPAYSNKNSFFRS